jgi:hypothetical protein
MRSLPVGVIGLMKLRWPEIYWVEQFSVLAPDKF